MVARGYVGTMHRVDQEKVSPHEAIGTIHALQPAFQNAGPGIELPARLQAAAPQHVWVRDCGQEGKLVVAIAIVKPPRLVAHAFCRIQTLVERSAWERR